MTRAAAARGSFWQRWLGGKPEPAPRPTVLPNEGLEAFQEGRHGEAERLLATDLARQEQQHPDSMAVARAIVALGELYRGQARFSEAEPLLTRAIRLIERVGGHEDPALVRPLNSLALVYRAQGLYAEAEPLARRALAIAEAAHGPEHPETAGVVGNLLTVCLAQGLYVEAAPLFHRAVALKERLLGPGHPELAASLRNYAAFLRKTRHEDEAAAWEARARAISGAQDAAG